MTSNLASQTPEPSNRPASAKKRPTKQVKQIVSGVLLLDKPTGMTSQQVVSKVKYLFKSAEHDSRKAGHTGTLDPMATGLLPICFGEATKFSHYQLEAVKSYHAVIKLGEQTDTGDADGQVIATADVPFLSVDQLQQVSQHFIGELKQTPPMYSALKQQGKKLYELAREGIEVDRQARGIHVFDLSLDLSLDRYHPSDEQKACLSLSVTCSKGTYVRVLAEDIAQALGTLGHLVALRRTQTGGFALADAMTLGQLETLSLSERLQTLLPIDACLPNGMACIELDDNQVERVRHGQRLNLANAVRALNLQTTAEVKLIDNAQAFIGLGLLEPTGRLQPKRIIKP